jgi:hypothetical protein
MMYASYTWGYVLDPHLSKLGVSTQLETLRGTHWSVNFIRLSKFLVYDYITKLHMTQGEVVLNHLITNVHGTGQGETMHRKYKRTKLGSGQAYI